MERYVILAIVLYALFVVLYLLRERMIKRKKSAAKKSAFNPFKSSPKEDIIGKSGFDLRHSLPEATTLIESDKRGENTPTFVPENAGKETQNTPVAIPSSELDKVFSSGKADNSGEIDLAFNDGPKGEESDNYEEYVDTEESEDKGDSAAGVSLATGLDFDNLSGMVKTVDNPEAATEQEKEEAGRVLAEVRQTDMFEQVVSGEPQKKVTAGKLMDDYFAAYHHRKREAGELDEPTVKAPKEFDARSFA